MSLFYLGSMLAYITGTEKDKGILTYILSPLLFILAVFTRETAITLPLALLLWDIFNTEETGRLGKAFRRQVVHWMLLVIILVAFFLHLKYEQLFEFSFELRGIKENLLSQFNGLGYLLSRLVAVNSLNIDPDIPVFFEWAPSIVIKAILILSLLTLSLITFRTKRWISFGILWLFLQILPTNSIVPRLDIANERHMYLPAWGIFLIVAIGVEKLRTSYYKQRHLFHVGILALLIVMGYFTWARNNIYRSEVALWEDTVLKSPNKARCYNNLGFAYELEGRYREAKEAYICASDLDPDFILAKNNLRKVESILEDNR
jgi:tetratricopeptide (TPR) repeat protein